ncbi:MAG: hypothetical protein KBB58_12685 [Ferruginibacter sp.]|nr:hypothetical protein [Ferruginibacter sp.]
MEKERKQLYKREKKYRKTIMLLQKEIIDVFPGSKLEKQATEIVFFLEERRAYFINSAKIEKP